MRITAKFPVLIFSIFTLPLVQATPGSLLKTLGLQSGQSYGLAKAQLIAQGWKVDTTYTPTRETGEAVPYGFEEVVCGNGWQAVCSGRFLRNDQEIMLTLKPKKVLVVEGAWNDS